MSDYDVEVESAQTPRSPRSEDPLHSISGPGHWSRSNTSEAVPGVATPLSWTLWGTSVERATRAAAYAMGALSKRERELPDGGRRYVRVFHGRPAVSVQFMAMLGDRLPCTSGREIAHSILGWAPEDIEYTPTRRRYPVVAWRFPLLYASVPSRLRRAARETDRWYDDQIAGIQDLDLAAATEMFRQANAAFERMLTLQISVLLGVVQPTHDALERLLAKAGTGDVAVLSGSGGAEVAGMVSDIWEYSRGRLGLEEVVRRHGFHGPAEGELSSRVWREDQGPLISVAAHYRGRAEGDVPAELISGHRRERIEAERRVLHVLPRPHRLAALLVLRLAASRLPLRGIAKRSFLQAFDVARASARRIGACLAADGVLADPDDVFYLTVEEITGLPPDGIADVVNGRRARRAEYQQLELPVHWQGMPVPLPAVSLAATPTTGSNTGLELLRGVGVSHGVVEGLARVLHTADFDEVEPDEVLVAQTTDPSWAAVMFISRALVMDTGGSLSHAAVVARELDIPCVVNTGSGTRTIRTGDHLRVDGRSGVVEILARADQNGTHPST